MCDWRNLRTDPPRPAHLPPASYEVPYLLYNRLHLHCVHTDTFSTVFHLTLQFTLTTLFSLCAYVVLRSVHVVCPASFVDWSRFDILRFNVLFIA